MKVLIFAAGQTSLSGFPLVCLKPRCLYRERITKEIPLERMINQLLDVGFFQEDITIIVGYQYKKIIKFVNSKSWTKINFKVNHLYKESVAHTLHKALEGLNDDFIYIFSDEVVTADFFRCLKNTPNKMFIRGSEGKVLKEFLPISKKIAEEYLYKETITNTNTKQFPYGVSTTKNGIGFAYMMVKIEQAIENFEKLEVNLDVELTPHWWITDLDNFTETCKYESTHDLFKFYFKIRPYFFAISYKRLRNFAARLIKKILCFF